jgi:hypothetical protein
MGIGATTAIFSIVNGVLIKPLPYPEHQRLVGVWQTAPGIGIDLLNMSPATYYTYREERRTFDDLGVWTSGTVTVTGMAEPEQVEVVYVTDGTRDDDIGLRLLANAIWRRSGCSRAPHPR